MEKERIEKLVNSFQAKAERAYENYQATGMSRYDSEYSRNEEIAEALRIAVNTADIAQAATNYKVEIVNLASRAEQIMHNGEDPTPLLKDIVAFAAFCCGYRKCW